MFTERDLPDNLAAAREAYAPETIVLQTDRDFESLEPAQAEELGLLVDSLDPTSYPDDWLPPNSPELLERYAGSDFLVGMPGDGGISWTRQTDPPIVFVKPRLEGSPNEFVAFLIAEAFVQLSLGTHEHCLAFFGDDYPDLVAAAETLLSPAGAYQLANALHDAYVGLQTRELFGDWAEDYPELFDAWHDAGKRLEPRLDELPTMLNSGRVSMGDAAELACAAIKHNVEIPSPFGPLDSEAYLTYGPEFAVQWTERTFDALD